MGSNVIVYRKEQSKINGKSKEKIGRKYHQQENISKVKLLKRSVIYKFI